jgi:hypothetical protein
MAFQQMRTEIIGTESDNTGIYDEKNIDNVIACTVK